jgi:predicted CXXCH cytochrome family protein
VMREGCTTCHNPHGSINIKLLTERDYNLCLRCHMHSRYQSIGHYAHKRAINPASLGPRLTNCTGCHRAVHGSNYSREFRTE